MFLLENSKLELEYSYSLIKEVVFNAFRGCNQNIIEWFLVNTSSIPKDVVNKYSIIWNSYLYPAWQWWTKMFNWFFKNSLNLEKYDIQVTDLNCQEENGNTLLMNLVYSFSESLSVQFQFTCCQKELM